MPHDVKITWDVGVPDEVRASVEPLLADGLRLVPRWVADLAVEWVSDGEELASMSTQVEYRRATLTIHPNFLAQALPERQQVLRHEMLHLVTQPIVDVLADLIDACKVDKKMEAWAIEQSRRAKEGLVCDLEILLRTLA